MKTIITLIIGMLLGAGIFAVVLCNKFPGMMIQTFESGFGYDETVKMINESAAENGWAVAKIYNMEKRMQKAGFEDAARVKIIEICNAHHTYNILEGAANRLHISLAWPTVTYIDHNQPYCPTDSHIGSPSRTYGAETVIDV